MRDVFIHNSAIVEKGAVIGEGSKIWHFCHIMPEVIIVKSCTVGQNVFMANGVILGDNVKVQNNVSIYTGVSCEDNVFIGPSVVFTNVLNPRSEVNRKNEFLKTIVKYGASIGANATIVCGNDIGRYAFIGAGSVVGEKIPDYALIIGNPGRIVGWMSEFGERLEFDHRNCAICKRTNAIYLVKGGVVLKKK